VKLEVGVNPDINKNQELGQGEDQGGEDSDKSDRTKDKEDQAEEEGEDQADEEEMGDVGGIAEYNFQSPGRGEGEIIPAVDEEEQRVDPAEEKDGAVNRPADRSLLFSSSSFSPLLVEVE